MHKQFQPNQWSCLPTAFAIALDMPVDEFLRYLSHNGSEIIWPQLSEPGCRRGFHIQECIRVLDRLGYTVTPFEAVPCHAPSMDLPPYRLLFGGSELAALKQFEIIINSSFGVLTGLSRVGHAVAYERGTVCDPSLPIVNGIYRYSSEECLKHTFIPLCAWSIK